MSGSKKTTTRERRKVERPAPEKGAGKPDGAVDDGELEGVAGGVHPVLNFPVLDQHSYHHPEQH